MNKARIHLFNGLGDKFLDMIGFYVICKRLNYTPNVRFDLNLRYQWGTNQYDPRLFDFSDVSLLHEPCDFYINSISPSVSLCPDKVYKFIKQFYPDITLEEISKDFIVFAKQIIRPTEPIEKNIPNRIEHAYGIHLRKSDKVNDGGSISHENTTREFDRITRKMLTDIEGIIHKEIEPSFLVVSEDIHWKQQISRIILDISIRQNKKIHLLEINYQNDSNYCNYNSVLDMFCLSRCKEILQGVKYSTFSILASLIGTQKIRNYSYDLDHYNHFLLHGWSSVIQINDNPVTYCNEVHSAITNHAWDINTNITKIFTNDL